MKLLKTKNRIISLENVIEVEKHESVTNHTSYGKKYSITHYAIIIHYTNDKANRIECGEDKKGKENSETIFEKIYEILSKSA